MPLALNSLLGQLTSELLESLFLFLPSSTGIAGPCCDTWLFYVGANDPNAQVLMHVSHLCCVFFETEPTL